MASEKSIPIVSMLMISLLMMMYSTDVAVASLSACELGCHASCLAMGTFYQTCYHACVILRCHHVVVPTLDSSYDLVSNPQTECKMGCVSSKCMDGLSDAKKTAACVTSCAVECDNRKN